MNRLIAIVGPTAIGKSRLSLRLASLFDGEIVSADSRQVYRHMDIGTAKPTPEEMASIPHHLIDTINPDESFSVAQFQELAYTTIKTIHENRRLPLLVGGTGQYVWAVLEGWEIPRIAPDIEFRLSLGKKSSEELYQMLLDVDPDSAEKIGKTNVRRITRALEVHKQAKTPFSVLRTKRAPGFETLIIGLTAGRAEVYWRADNRVDEMVKRDLVTEVERLLRVGYDLSLPAMSSVGYKQIGAFLKGELSLEEAISRIKTDTHRIIRHQYAWFSLRDKRIHWFDVQKEIESEVVALVSRFVDSETAGV